MVEAVKQRDRSVDVLRGIAMLLVVLGHTMTGSTLNSEKSFLFNIVWSLQMPLFFLISGYVTRYSRQITSGKAFGKFIIRRTIAYMLPFFVWTFIIRGIVFGQTSFFNVKHLVYNMDSGYWFLFSIYVIAFIFGVSELLSNTINKGKNQYKGILLTAVFFVLGAIALGGLGILMGLDFLCIKLTLYYMPFYFAGYVFGKFKDKILTIEWIKKAKEAFIAIAVIIYVFVIAHVELYSLSESSVDILIRAATSLFGCIAVCSLISNFANPKNKLLGFLDWAGLHSLEIYLIHGLVLNVLKVEPLLAFSSWQGLVLVASNFIITMIIVFCVTKILNQNKVLNIVLFGKGK